MIRPLRPLENTLWGFLRNLPPYNLRESSWPEEKERFVQRIIDTLAAYAPNLPGAIEHVHALSPLDLEQEYGLTGG